jgi:transketolase
MRNAFSEALYQEATKNPKIHIVVADISPAGSMNKLRDQYPKRFINVGVAEQVMIGIAAGMALKGLQPFAYTIATFTLYRPFEMVRDDLCYQNLPVTIVGMGAGVTYSTLGGTHHTMEDVAVASAIPNMRVLAPCDPAELVHATRYCATQRDGPVYLRIGKAGEPNFTDKIDAPFEFGKLRAIRRGTDTAILAYGPIMKRAVDLADRLAAKGENVSLYSAHTLKPLDRAGVARVLAGHKRVVTIEEHVPHGGLGSRVKEIACDERSSTPVTAFSLKDEFIHFYGSHDELLDVHGLGVAEMQARLSP